MSDLVKNEGEHSIYVYGGACHKRTRDDYEEVAYECHACSCEHLRALFYAVARTNETRTVIS